MSSEHWWESVMQTVSEHPSAQQYCPAEQVSEPQIQSTDVCWFKVQEGVPEAEQKYL